MTLFIQFLIAVILAVALYRIKIKYGIEVNRCNCGEDDDGWTPFYAHSETCPRFRLIDTTFDNSGAHNQRIDNNITHDHKLRF